MQWLLTNEYSPVNLLGYRNLHLNLTVLVFIKVFCFVFQAALAFLSDDDASDDNLQSD